MSLFTISSGKLLSLRNLGAPLRKHTRHVARKLSDCVPQPRIYPEQASHALRRAECECPLLRVHTDLQPVAQQQVLELRSRPLQ